MKEKILSYTAICSNPQVCLEVAKQMENVVDHLLIYYYWLINYIIAVQPLSHVQLFATTWTAALQASLSFDISPTLL